MFKHHEEGARLFSVKATTVIFYSTVGSVTMQETWHSTNLALLKAPLEAEVELETRGKC